MTNTFLVVTVLLVLTIPAFVILRRGMSPETDDNPWPFYAKKPLTQPEQVLYHRIVAAMPECIVLAQVQVSRVLGVKNGYNPYEWNNRINRMSLDFLVCLKDSTVVAAVELDDSTHAGESRIKADANIDKALSDAGIVLVRWHVNALPDESAIRQTLASDAALLH